MDLKRSYGGAAVKKRLGQFLLKVSISIPYMVRIIQTNFKKWTTIVIIEKISLKLALPYLIKRCSKYYLGREQSFDKGFRVQFS